MIALIGCLLGNFFSVIGFLSQELSIGVFDVFQIIPFNILVQVTVDSFELIDLLFYGIAVVEGYKFSFRIIKEEEIIANAAESIPGKASSHDKKAP